MFGRKVSDRLAKRPTHSVQLKVEELEDRSVPHGSIVEFAAGITPAAGLTGITNGPDGNFWFTEFNTSRVGRLTPAGTITEFTLVAGRGPVNIALGADNNLYFTENSGDRIGRINPLAGSDAAIQASIAEFAVPGAGSNPNGITAGPDGALWFTQSGSDEIGRLTTAGVITEFAVPGVGSAPSGIAANSDGALWFTQAGSGQIGRITTAGVITEFNIPVPANGVSDPEGITAGPNGALFFADFGRDQIGRITADGTITQFSLPVGRGPHQIVASADGDLYFTMPASGRIGRLPAASLLPGRPTSGSPPLEEFDFIRRTAVPLGIALDSEGDIYFTQNEGNAIGFFEAHLGQLTVTATGRTIQTFDRDLNPVSQYEPFAGFGGTFRVAVNDLNNNGVPDAVVIADGPGGRTHVKVFDGGNNALIASFFAFDPSFQGPVSIAAEDTNGDARPEIIVSAGTHVKVIDGLKFGEVQANGQIADSALLASFFAFDPAFGGGVTLAAVDLNADARFDIIVGAGPGAGPHVKVIDAAKLGQVQANGQIADSALLASFFAFDPSFRGGVFVAIGFNDVQRKIVVGAGPGATPHVKVIDGTKLGQVQANGQIADSALLANFFAFTPTFGGGVRVSADDINSDAQSELILSAGPGAGPHIKVIDGARVLQTQADGQIADAAVLESFFTNTTGSNGGVFIASDADHRDGPIFGPPGITVTNSRRDVNDVFVFLSPTNAANTVLSMDLSPFSTGTTPNTFATDTLYDFRIANRELINTTDDLTFRVTFSAPDASGIQDVVVRALPAARFAGSGGVLIKGLTRQNEVVRGVGGSGALFRADERDDPFFFDAAGFNALLNNTTAVQGVVDGEFPRGTGTFGPGGTPNFNAPNFFGPSVNTLNITLEIPSARLTAPGSTAIGVWGRSEFGGVQVDRMGRPAINTGLIPPVPRGASITMPGADIRTAFNLGHPRDDRAVFGTPMIGVLTSFYPAGRPGGTPNAGQAGVVANLLLPDILVFDTTSSAGFGGNLVTFNGTTFLAGGRKFSDDVVSTELSVLTDDDLPAGLGGGPNAPALVTQNVADDNGLNLMDGSLVGPGSALSGMQRAAVFPYIGARNANPTPVPGVAPPP